MPAPTTRLARHGFAVLALALLGPLACQPRIGDPCKRSIDCGINVFRQCDISNAPNDPRRDGECTLENCSLGVCPREAICVKVYASEFLSVTCDPDLEDVPSFEGRDGRDDCRPNEVCLPEGLCADELRARTSCRLECSRNADCRDNYECVSTGSAGLYVAPDPERPTRERSAKICVPRG